MNLEAGEDGVIIAGIQGHYIHADGMGLMRFPRRLDNHLFVFSRDHVHKLLLLDRGYHDRPASGVHRYVLARDNSPAAALAEGLLVSLDKALVLGVELKDDELAGVGAKDEAIFVSLC